MEQHNEISIELKSLSNTVSAIEKKNPFVVPENYFEGLADKALQLIHKENSDTISPKEEIESLSPLLSSLKNKKTFSIPDSNYFEQVTNNVHTQITKTVDVVEAPVVSISSGRKWIRYAAAAVITGIIGISAIFFLNNTGSLSNDNSANGSSIVKQQLNHQSENDFSEIPDDMLDKYLSSIPDKPLIESNDESAHFLDLAAFDLDDAKLSSLLHEVSDEDLQSFSRDDDEKSVSL